MKNITKILIKKAIIAFLILANCHLCFSQNTENKTRDNEVQLKLGFSLIESISTNGFDALSVSLNYTKMLNKWFSLGIEYTRTTKNNLSDWFNENIIFNPEEHFDLIVDENFIGKSTSFDTDNPMNYYESNILFIRPNFYANLGAKFKLFFYPMIGIGSANQTELLLISTSQSNNIITEVNEYQILSWIKTNFYTGLGIGGRYDFSSKFFIDMDIRLTSRIETSYSQSDTFGSYGYGTIFIGGGIKF